MLSRYKIQPELLLTNKKSEFITEKQRKIASSVVHYFLYLVTFRYFEFANGDLSTRPLNNDQLQL